MNSIVPSIFGRFFSSQLSILFNESGVIICDAHSINDYITGSVTHFNDIPKRVGANTTYIQWNELIAPLVFESGFLGQKVSFATSHKRYKFSLMAYGSKHLVAELGQQYWVNANAGKLDMLLKQISKLISLRFLRQSQVSIINDLISTEYSRWFPWISTSKSLAIVDKNIKLLSKYAKWDKSFTQFFQEKYIQEQLTKYQTFFDQVESNPLTEKQRRACVIDDDNNFLLAGAGTGKTSVMVGRAGFLVNSKQANYDDILLLAYGRKAADEMDERIQNKLITDKINASTFHRIGLKILAQVEGGKPSLSLLAEDESIKIKWVQSCFESLLDNSSQYKKLALNYFSKYYYVEKNEFDFNSLGEYYQYLTDNDIRTLKGDKVRSFGELYIANWLFYHGIDYRYKAPYQVDVKTIDHRQYKPDFYLPEYELYIEYYGVDEQGNTASYINRDDYHAAMAWEMSLHEQHNTRCISLTYGQQKQGVLLSELNNTLVKLNISFALLPLDSILDSLKETGRVTVLAELFTRLLGLYKAAYLTENTEASLVANAEDSKQISKALALLKPILLAYNDYLRDHGEIDFEDMIIKAINYVESGLFKSPWKYIMVDEFQDISEPRARLVKALRDSHPGSSIFAVGDDWQAIYQFSGANLKLTTEFEQSFGLTTQTVLDVTFRFNNKIGDVAANFISKNPAQLTKQISSINRVTQPAVSIVRQRNNVTNQHDLQDILQAIQAKVCVPVTVYLLARFWFQLPTSSQIQQFSTHYPLLKISAQSFHGSKGKEADYVVIMSMEKGQYGFPSEKATSPLLAALLPDQDTFEHAEERRLFYVALTRAKHRVYILADMNKASVFINELMTEHEGDIALNELANECDDDNYVTYMDDIQCPRCDTGIMKKQSGRYGDFYACSHFPRCEHKENPCERCASPMTRKRYAGFKLCVNEQCNHIVPVCEQCNAEMVLRTSAKGDFWGCRNFRGNEILSCKNSKDSASMQWPERVN